MIMSRIKIKDLPQDKMISKEEMKRVLGGISYNPVSLKSLPARFLVLEPEQLSGAYNAAYFSLRKSEIL